MGMPTIESSGITRCEAITDIIQSVALQEASLAHILNAEGEKLQRVIADESVTTEELLKFNESVSSMVGTVKELETVLQTKLELFKGALTSCEDAVKEETTETTETTDEEVIIKEEIIADEEVNTKEEAITKEEITAE
ncbi:MAG: hypothetical protein R3Y32_02845 [Bacillota bacterium]